MLTPPSHITGSIFATLSFIAMIAVMTSDNHDTPQNKALFIEPVLAAAPATQKSEAGKIPIFELGTFEIPRIEAKSVESFTEISLPKPSPLEQLSSHDIKLYLHITALQRQEKWQEADKTLAQVYNSILTGHILAERYESNGYVSSYRELTDWLERYRDQPQAGQIYAIAAAKRQSSDLPLPPQPKIRSLKGFGDDNGLGQRNRLEMISDDAWEGRNEAYLQWQKLENLINNVELDYAETMLNSPESTGLLNAEEQDVARWQIAAQHLYRGNASTAYHLAHTAANRSGNNYPKMHWIAGIAAWQLQQVANAAPHFSAMADSPTKLSSWEHAAASYWAYRSLNATGQSEQARMYLVRATSHPRTFYGVLARKAEGRLLTLAKQVPELDLKKEKSWLQQPGIRRAFALSQIERPDLAEQELRVLYMSGGKKTHKKLLALATILDIPSAQLTFAHRLKQRGVFYDRALYPAPRWVKEADNDVDPLLMAAFIRQESGFNPLAAGPNGARGLMQIMPTTARMMKRKFKSAQGDGGLLNLQSNLNVGKTYLSYLLKQKNVNGNLIALAASYNAGPSVVSEWQKSTNYHGDALLFMESMPYALTRNYVAQVMTNYWIYKELDNATDKTTLAMAQGSWPLYRYDKPAIALADGRN